MSLLATPLFFINFMTDTAYPKLKAAEDVFKSVVWDNMVEAALVSLFAYMPGLAIWPLGNIIRSVVKLFSGKLFELIRLGIDLEAISFVNNQHKTAYSSALVKLKLIAKDKGVDSEEFKKEKENAKEALAKFVSFGGR